MASCISLLAHEYSSNPIVSGPTRLGHARMRALDGQAVALQLRVFIQERIERRIPGQVHLPDREVSRLDESPRALKPSSLRG